MFKDVTAKSIGSCFPRIVPFFFEVYQVSVGIKNWNPLFFGTAKNWRTSLLSTSLPPPNLPHICSSRWSALSSLAAIAEKDASATMHAGNRTYTATANYRAPLIDTNDDDDENDEEETINNINDATVQLDLKTTLRKWIDQCTNNYKPYHGGRFGCNIKFCPIKRKSSHYRTIEQSCLFT